MGFFLILIFVLNKRKTNGFNLVFWLFYSSILAVFRRNLYYEFLPQSENFYLGSTYILGFKES